MGGSFEIFLEIFNLFGNDIVGGGGSQDLGEDVRGNQ